MSPLKLAADLRSKAENLSGPERDYCLWLALEWEKTAARHGSKPAQPERPAAKD